MKNGTVKYVNPAKFFGFITPDVKGQPDLYFAFEQLSGDAARLPIKGDAVLYEQGIGKRGPVATSVYNMADPVAVENYECDQETVKRLQAAKQAAQEGQAEFRKALYERNRQWRAAQTPSPMYRPTDTFEQKVAMAERRLRDEICEEHRLLEVMRKGATRFPQSGQIAYEVHLHRKGRAESQGNTLRVISRNGTTYDIDGPASDYDGIEAPY